MWFANNGFMSAALAGALVVFAGCGGGSEELTGGGECSEGLDLPFETGPAGKCECTATPTNNAFCAAQQPAECEGTKDTPLDSCGVLIGEPAQVNELVRTTDTIDYAEGGPVDLSCFEPANYPVAGASQTVRMEGRVKIFAAGCDAIDVRIEVYKIVPGLDPTADRPGELVGQAVETTVDSPVENDHFDGDCSDPRQLRRFVYEGVPTETELVIKTSGSTALAGWATLYDYNVYIPSNDPDLDTANGVWNHDVRALAADDFATIPSAAMGSTITNGNGGLAGEIHDCGNIRLSYALTEVNRARRALVYLSDNEEDPMPQVERSRIGTAKLGLYAALDIQPGPIQMSAVGVLGGKLVTLGYANAHIHPNSISLVTLRGVRPFQVP